MINLTNEAKFTRVLNATAAGNSDTVASNSVDMKGFSNVTFAASLGAIAAAGTGTVKAQQSHDNNSADTWADLTGTGVAYTNAAANAVVLLEIVEPQERYVRLAVARANTGNTAIDAIVAIQTLAGSEPVEQSASVFAAELHASPAEGAA